MTELEQAQQDLEWARREYAELGDSGTYRMIKKLEAKITALEAR